MFWNLRSFVFPKLCDYEIESELFWFIEGKSLKILIWFEYLIKTWIDNKAIDNTSSTSFLKTSKKETLPECPESGLPLCLTSTKIVGRGEHLKKLRHANLQSLVDVESSNQERIVFVSEKPSQPSLLEMNGKLSNDEGICFAQQLFSALDFLHCEGFVHGQISNKLVHYDGNAGTLKLSEWFVNTLTDFGDFAGTNFRQSIKYSAPEVIISKLRDPSAIVHPSDWDF